jgi:hypothetical protein
MTTLDEAIRFDLVPEAMERDLARLVLTLAEFVRRLLEAQAIRRVEAGSLTDDEAERVGFGLLRAREAVETICRRLEVDPSSLNLDLGPLGRLM